MVRGVPCRRSRAALSWSPERLLDPFPRVRALLACAHTALPLPYSRWAYTFGRLILPDPRRAGFELAMAEAARRGGGVYLEFGVHRGASLLLAQQCAERAGLTSMRCVVFDSFEGLPGAETAKFWRGRFAFSEQRFRRWFERAGGDPSRVEVVAGWFSDTLTPQRAAELHLGRIAVVHIDCDLYDSSLEVLRWLEPLPLEGAVLILDDWHAYDADPGSHGIQRALAESQLRARLTGFGKDGTHVLFSVGE
ncbi:MAG: TylF/MycF/NovP-related O-methyltransferase [Chloroflexota bacterium]